MSPSVETQQDFSSEMTRKRSRNNRSLSPDPITDRSILHVKSPRFHEAQDSHRQQSPSSVPELRSPDQLVNDTPNDECASTISQPTQLNEVQRKFVKHWLKSFDTDRGNSTMDDVTALSTLMRIPFQPIWDYINSKSKHSTTATGERGGQMCLQPRAAFAAAEQSTSNPSAYNLVEANKHLPQPILQMVDKYVRSSQRRRATSDGRRTVNAGPYRCTFNCGYATKRAFDWQRHEETHEPQKLWLCHYCRQNDDSNPFLVNRKDKFLKHARDAHEARDPEEVLDMSKLRFNAKFDPQCPLCPQRHDTWEERCQCVLNHYDDAKIQKSRKGVYGTTGVEEGADSPFEQSGSDILDDMNSNESSKDDV